MKNEKRISKKSDIYSLEPYLAADGLLRVRGTLELAPIQDSLKHPAIVSQQHHVTELIVRHTHEVRTLHSGREHTLGSLRQHFWISRCRPLINRVIRSCMICKRRRAEPLKQRMSDLPEDRVTPGKPAFSHVGVDCFGPFLVKKGRRQEKKYGCLFTCLEIRAIHIEKLDSLEADAFINALIRFSARRGTPELIRSDNGTNFTGAERELRETMQTWNRSPPVEKWFQWRNIEWHFNPPASSHMGGVWERMIRTVRKVLTSVVGSQVLDDERLATLFCEVESVVNSRPLTIVSDDPEDLEPLTPEDLLLLRKGARIPPGEFVERDCYRRRWRHVQFLSDQFWRRWIQEYLPTLQLRQKWQEPQRNLTVGDIVLVRDEITHRKEWPLARVVDTKVGADGQVRSATIKTAYNVLVRPITKLCLLQTASSD